QLRHRLRREQDDRLAARPRGGGRHRANRAPGLAVALRAEAPRQRLHRGVPHLRPVPRHRPEAAGEGGLPRHPAGGPRAVAEPPRRGGHEALTASGPVRTARRGAARRRPAGPGRRGEGRRLGAGPSARRRTAVRPPCARRALAVRSPRQRNSATLVPGGDEAAGLTPRSTVMADESVLPANEPVPDEIVRSILIKASAERVFAVIGEPGWFLNDGEYREHRISEHGPVTQVTDPIHGTFQLAVEAHEPPNRVAFRWLGGGL